MRFVKDRIFAGCLCLRRCFVAFSLYSIHLRVTIFAVKVKVFPITFSFEIIY